MVSVARKYLPFEMRLVFQHSNVPAELWETGAVKPDRVFRDFRNHVWHVVPNKKGRHFGNAPGKIADEVKLISQMFADNKDLATIAEEMAIASHYLADINNPLHTGTHPAEKKIHSRFEKDFQRYGDKSWQFDGYNVHTKISTWIIETAKRGWSRYQQILTAYLEGGRFKDIKKVSQKCYNEGLNDIIDLFYNIYIRSGSQLYRYPQLQNSQIKIDVNQASSAELAELYYISPRLARRLIRFRNKRNGFKSLTEMLKVKGMSRKKLNKLNIFLTINSKGRRQYGRVSIN